MTSRSQTNALPPSHLMGCAPGWGWPAQLGMLVGLCLCTVTLRAADTSSAAAAALKVLTAGAAPAMTSETPGTVNKEPSPNSAAQNPKANRITVRSGESIDAVLRRALPGLPLKDEFLRQALAKANPRIFPKGRTYPVRPGTVLTIPSHDELRQMIMVQSPAAAALFQAPAQSETDQPKGPDKRHWVRFP